LQTAVADALKQSFVIEGGNRLSGSVRATGNKNAALPILAACVLTDQPVELENVPRIKDVDTMLALLRQIGGEADWTGPNDVRVHVADVTTHELDEELCREIRASILLAGPLLARCGKAVVPPPGGDVIGRRRLDTHIHALDALGARISIGQHYELEGRLTGTMLFLDEASVTATENAVMAAVLASGETVIGNAACEPHVQDVCEFLVSLGARIDGIGTNRLRVEGVGSLGGGAHRVCPEHIEVASFICLAAVTDSEITIEDTAPDDLGSILPVFARLGVHVDVEGTSVHVPSGQKLAVLDDLGGQIPKVEDGPWPAFPADLTSIAVVLATQARGTVLVFEKMFESRLFFVDKLVGMGARIIVCDPHRVVVAGPAQMYGQRMESPDIRAGMALLIASLCAEGTSTIGNIGQIDRGYERIDERLRGLGARIERVDG
jgi:UDP-N-acetylglucosamine 1-carboxyvinyltransferase